MRSLPGIGHIKIPFPLGKLIEDFIRSMKKTGFGNDLIMPIHDHFPGPFFIGNFRYHSGKVDTIHRGGYYQCLIRSNIYSIFTISLAYFLRPGFSKVNTFHFSLWYSSISIKIICRKGLPCNTEVGSSSQFPIISGAAVIHNPNGFRIYEALSCVPSVLSGAGLLLTPTYIIPAIGL